jgi:hypothetical protein
LPWEEEVVGGIVVVGIIVVVGGVVVVVLTGGVLTDVVDTGLVEVVGGVVVVVEAIVDVVVLPPPQLKTRRAMVNKETKTNIKDRVFIVPSPSMNYGFSLSCYSNVVSKGLSSILALAG